MSNSKMQSVPADHRDILVEQNGRVIALVDMDAFEVQIYLRKKIKNWREVYENYPCVLADSRTDRLVSVNYVAKKLGVTREDGVKKATQKVEQTGQELVVHKKDQEFGKSESSSLRLASYEIIDCVKAFRKQNKLKFTFESASNDEFYLDLSQDVDQRRQVDFPLSQETLGRNTHLEGASKKIKANSILYKSNVIFPRNPMKYTQEAKLVMGATILRELLQHIYNKTGGLDASAGIGSNKLIAKLAVSEHKPGGITILPEQGLIRVGQRIRVEKIPTLGGKRGVEIKEKLGALQNHHPVTMFDIANRSFYQLMEDLQLGPIVTRGIHKLVNGYCDSPVIEKTTKDSLSVGISNLRHLDPRPWINNFDVISSILTNLVKELVIRLQEERSRHHRVAEKVTVEVTYNAKEMKKDRRWAIQMIFKNGQVGNVEFFVKTVMNEFQSQLQGIQGLVSTANIYVKEFIPCRRS